MVNGFIDVIAIRSDDKDGEEEIVAVGIPVAISREFEDLGPAAQHYDSNGHVQGHLGVEISRCEGRFILDFYYTCSPCIERNNLQGVLLDLGPLRPRWRVLTLKNGSNPMS